jgi:hypothetical protein
MKLRQTIIQRILDKNSPLSLLLASALDFTQTWIRELANANKVNGPLTTAAAIVVIKKDMGIFDDSEILEKADSVAA